MKKVTKEEVHDVVDSCFIAKYNGLFNKYIQDLSPETRETIRKHTDLDKLFDLFVDFIIDSSQHLDYKLAKAAEKDLDQN